MTARPIFVLCEGSHDIAFLGRLLAATIGAEPLQTPVVDLPAPLGRFFVRRFEKRAAASAEIKARGAILQDEPPVLQTAFISADGQRHWYFMNCGGDCQQASIRIFLDQLASLSQVPEPQKGLEEFAVVFVNDADLGTGKRLEKLQADYADSIKIFMPSFATFESARVQKHGKYAVGVCIFAKPGSEEGTLEDIVWPLMHAAASARHDDATSFVNNHADAKPVSKKLKAALTIAGQPECVGSSLAVVLRDSVALQASALKADSSCCELANILQTI